MKAETRAETKGGTKVDGVAPSSRLRPGQTIHLVAVGGVGMSALAGLLQAQGFRVTGSDEAIYPPASTLLEQLRIAVRHGYRPEHLDSADAVIIGNAVTRTNPEAAAALERGLPVFSMPEILGDLFLSQRRTLVVAGTHGKTTTTAMLAWVLQRAGRAPGFLVGGVPIDLGVSFAVGEGEDFVIEGDEYDSAFFDKRPKFIHYRPQAVLLNAVEFDHADIYKDLEHVKRAFADLVRLLPREAPLVVASEFPHAVEVARGATRDAILFGAGPGSAWRAVNVRDDGECTVFAVEAEGQPVATVRLQLPGDMNVRNALGVFVLCRSLGMAAREIVPGLESFRGVRRRQEHVGERRGVVVLDDFAHHPTAVAGTLAAVRARYRERRVIAVFEPRSNTSRRRVFQQAFADALACAPVVILSAVYEKPNDPLPPAERLSTDELVADLRSRGIAAAVLPSPDAIAQHLAATATRGDVVVIMSNGAFGGLPRRLLEMLGAPGAADAPEAPRAPGAAGE
jgi:UDP-N-acetylmuramate: L-alanyl-gamma-D-glutamyl-meso-diaminopimelate ligase